MFVLFGHLFLDGRLEGEKIFHLGVLRAAAEKTLMSASL